MEALASAHGIIETTKADCEFIYTYDGSTRGECVGSRIQRRESCLPRHFKGDAPPMSMSLHDPTLVNMIAAGDVSSLG
jgi:hypothetical protein